MRTRLFRLGILTSFAAFSQITPARAAQTLRVQVDQRGDFVAIGNTLGHDCGAGVAPVVGTVGACGFFQADSAPDVFWRSQEPPTPVPANRAAANTGITLAQARSTALLSLPAGAQVTHAYLFWAARTGSAAGDTQVTLDRPGGFTTNVTADTVYTLAQGTDIIYESVADVTATVQAGDEGAYRVSGVDATNFVNLNQNVTFAAWSLVVFYSLSTDPTRNLALFDGLDGISNGNPSNVNLTGFLVPNAGFDAKLGAITYEGDDQNTGDSLLFGTAPLVNADRLTDGENPIANFFNSTRSLLGTAVSVVGDFPQLTGGAASMSSYDLDVVDVTGRLVAGQSAVDIQATTNQDVYYLGAFVTSISTFRPEFDTSTKGVSDVNGGSVLPGDVLEYTIDVTNTGNDTAVGVVLADAVPNGVTYVPGSITIDGVAKTDAGGDDQANFAAGTRIVTARLGTGASATLGGTMVVGASTTVRFRVTVDGTTSGTISNQATITASGQLGAPPTTTPTDGNGGASGQPPTDVTVDECVTAADCAAPRPFCDTAPNPNVCVECLNNAQCPASAPRCVPATNTCGPCTANGQCPAPLPVCLPSGTCGECSLTNTTRCTGTTPFCDTGTNVCVECLSNAQCPASAPRCVPATNTCGPCTANGQCPAPLPACLPSGTCGECSATNATRCTGTTPFCDTGTNTCVGCRTSADCTGTTPVCRPATDTCGPCVRDAQCPAATPACQPNGSCGECSATNPGQCRGSTPRCDTSTGTCEPGCTTNLDCSGLTPICNTATSTCVGCITSADCRAPTPICDPADSQCWTCLLDSHCPATAPTCVPGTRTCECTGGAGACTDTDSDGITDAVETQIGTNPNDADTDDDGVTDGSEPGFDQDSDQDGAINALDADSDDDGLFDGTELGLGCSGAATNAALGHCRPDADLGATTTDPLAADTDGGGARDGSEDSDLDGALDSGETDPTSGNAADDASVTDGDGDGLSDRVEDFLGSDPEDLDSDDDGVPDGQEANPSDDVDRDGLVDVRDVDSDDDGLFDGTETARGCAGAGTNAAAGHCTPDGDSGTTVTSMILPDTDRGGVRDGSEDADRDGVVDTGELDPTSGHGPDDGTATDSDGDGLSDDSETSLGSDPNDADTDDDGVPDGREANPADDGDGDGTRNVSDHDSDGDGLFDGTEVGLGCGDAATNAGAGHCRADQDGGATTTSMVDPDTDGGGVRDGDEDANHDGAVDVGERDPNDPADDVRGDAGVPDGGVSDGGVSDGGVSDAAIGDAAPDVAIAAGGGSGTGGALGAGGTGSGGLAASAGGATGTGAVPGAGGDSSVGSIEGGGCACNLPDRSGRGTSALSALALLALGAAFRRRAKLPVR